MNLLAMFLDSLEGETKQREILKVEGGAKGSLRKRGSEGEDVSTSTGSQQKGGL